MIKKNSNPAFPAGEKNFTIEGPAGALELLTSTPKQILRPEVAVICHPHPLYGGTMHNKVVHTLARTFKEMGMRTVRFNFRGIGASQGNYANGIGETDDLLAVMHWVQQAVADVIFWSAGFSFGSYVAACATKTILPAQLISIAPPIENFNFTPLMPIECPWLVVQGEKDEVVSAQAVFDWIAKMPNPPELIRMPDATHFFHGQLIELQSLLIEKLSHA